VALSLRNCPEVTGRFQSEAVITRAAGLRAGGCLHPRLHGKTRRGL